MSAEMYRDAFERAWKPDDLKRNPDGTYWSSVVENAFKDFCRGWNAAWNFLGVDADAQTAIGNDLDAIAGKRIRGNLSDADFRLVLSGIHTLTLPKNVAEAIENVNACRLHTFDEDWQTIRAHLLIQESRLVSADSLLRKLRNAGTWFASAIEFHGHPGEDLEAEVDQYLLGGKPT
ncbi:MAG: hypothetical protein WBR17_39190 [Paraburkholderia sp.]|uniref:hypothetical protein n=1 Tax=Paraburkholderia sp. TaxID=1926495 RepID=UPI003C684B08